MNSCVFAGNLGQDPKCGKNQAGKSWASASLAVYDGKDKEGNKRTVWIELKAFDKSADRLSQYTKGSFVTVSARAAMDTFQDKQGEQKSKMVFWVNDCDGPIQRASTSSAPQVQDDPWGQA
jgi:single-stranded DNA-binding protein